MYVSAVMLRCGRPSGRIDLRCSTCAMTKKLKKSKAYSCSQAGPHLFFFCVGQRTGARAAARSAGDACGVWGSACAVSL